MRRSLDIFSTYDCCLIDVAAERATNSQNQKPDVAAIEAFCVMLTKESEGVQIGTKLLATHIQSLNEPEALQALSVLSFFNKILKIKFCESTVYNLSSSVTRYLYEAMWSIVSR